MKQLGVIISGFGGQGILSCGQILAYAGVFEGKQVSWLPSYGPEMRGGTANCQVAVSDEPIGSPILNKADVVIAMNGPSFEKFENTIVPNGIMIYDSALITNKPSRTDIRYIGIPATQFAQERKKPAFANIVLLGKLVKETGIIKADSFEKALYKVLPVRHQHLIPEEIEVFNYGADY
jgi:2-oxoglutarate ferredoxin oxidoreductase subunit gamma